jgi:hypothetical protein
MHFTSLSLIVATRDSLCILKFVTMRNREAVVIHPHYLSTLHDMVMNVINTLRILFRYNNLINADLCLFHIF